jgi:hypothetical protein
MMLRYYWGCAYEEAAAVDFAADNGSSSLPLLPPSLLVLFLSHLKRKQTAVAVEVYA